MKTIIIKENSKQAKALIEMLKTFDFVEFVTSSKSKQDSYDENFVETVKNAQKSKNRTRVTSKNLWESI